MRNANISTLKNNLSRYVEYVRGGGVVRVFDRERPVAELVPLGASRGLEAPALEAIFKSLEDQGILRRGRGRPNPELLRGPLPKGEASVVDILLRERREGR